MEGKQRHTYERADRRLLEIKSWKSPDEIRLDFNALNHMKLSKLTVTKKV